MSSGKYESIEYMKLKISSLEAQLLASEQKVAELTQSLALKHEGESNEWEVRKYKDHLSKVVNGLQYLLVQIQDVE